MFAVVETGGKQYRVTIGQSFQVEKLPGAKGDVVEFDRVLLVGDGESVTAGSPLVEGARVVATLSRQERAEKIRVLRYKSKKRIRVHQGHRQDLSLVFVRDIVLNGEGTTAWRPREAAAEQLDETTLLPASSAVDMQMEQEPAQSSETAAPEAGPTTGPEGA